MIRSESPYPSAATPLPTLSLLERLNRRLAETETKVEFYFLGGAVLFQAFHAAPGTARVTAQFKSPGVLRDAAARVGAAEGEAASRWPVDAVRRLVGEEGPPSAHVEWSHLAVFAPLPAYVLAVKCAALHLGEGAGATDDLRYVLRAMNVRSAAEALDIVTRYFTESQLAPATRGVLEGLLGDVKGQNPDA